MSTLSTERYKVTLGINQPDCQVTAHYPLVYAATVADAERVAIADAERVYGNAGRWVLDSIEVVA